MKLLLTALTLLVISNSVYSFKVNRESSLMRGLRHRNPDFENQVGVSDSPQPQSQWFDQQVDHYDPLNTATFKQQYFVNDTYWTTGGPVFLLLGGEGPASVTSVTGHFVINTYAQQFGALIVSVEHRFYGKSSPSKTLATEYLNLLTTQQALADFANFRQFIAAKYNVPSTTKWVSFGGSYSGSLSAWLRLKYPQLIDAAIATSAPVQPQLDFPEYFEVVARSVGPACSARIAEVTNLVTQMLQTDRKTVEKLFNTCDPIVSSDDVATFFESLSDGISEIVQYNNDNNKYTMFNISHMCSLLDGGDPLQSFVNFNNEFNQFSGNKCTQSSYKSMIAQMRETEVNGENAAGRLWTWQTCTEYGYFQTSESPNQPFSSSITLDWFLQQCADIFGPKPDGKPYLPAIEWIETDFGGRNIQTSNTIFPNGLIDPWHILGVLNATTSSISTAIIPLGAHCSDLYPPLPTDNEALVLARQMEVNLISSILP
ncbi:Putative serine protease [Heterostelium album PN500]|uniref:Serine protease n=1 Tax=Heterostelium pallidum (strain ATCC 26659 / Pp 5 / PN500) TaxID=670386 RepID=D3BEJ2_HETP5|nr:Putative serine protease [Heterostelium album PN500]EFA80323.1 Putative serine protease [Heterostelium album PN500]|eukprot:XP_020432443.1 Putative serine protease [Heterostelium album PN500]